MRSSELAGGERRILVFDKGDEVVSTLEGFARRESVTAASFTAIGAFSRAKLGWFDREARDYEEIGVDEQVEVVSLSGDIALADGEPKVHAHVVVARRDGTAMGGHLLEGSVWPTLELVLASSPRELRKRSDRETGLALIDPQA